MGRQRFRKPLLLLHRWLGLFLALYVFLLSLTGSVLVWYREIDVWLNPEFLVPHQSGATGLG